MDGVIFTKLGKGESMPHRARKYTRIYSAHRTNSKDSTLKTFKTEDIQSQKQSFGHSKPFVSIEFLQKTAKALAYDIQKASSDRVELMRDLSTYELNLMQTSGLLRSLTDLKNLSESLPSFSVDAQTSDNCRIKSIEAGLLTVSQLNPAKFQIISAESEGFHVRDLSYSSQIRERFKGVCVISGVSALVSLVGDKWLQNLHFRVSALNLFLDLSFKQPMRNSLLSVDEIRREVKLNLLPCLSIQLSNSTALLIFDKNHSKTYYSIILKLRGFMLCTVMVYLSVANLIIVEVPIIGQSLSIGFPSGSLPQEVQKLTNIVKTNLFYCQKLKKISWGDRKSIFIFREKESSMLNDEYIRTSMNVNEMKEMYEVYHKKVKIKLLQQKESIVLRLEYGAEVVEISKDTKYYNFLKELQYINIGCSRKTLCCSLELEYLIKKLFPQYDNTINP